MLRRTLDDGVGSGMTLARAKERLEAELEARRHADERSRGGEDAAALVGLEELPMTKI